MVRAFALHAVALGSNPFRTSGLDLLPVVPDSTLPRFVVRAFALHAVALGSNPVLTSGLDLFPVVPGSILPRFVNSQLVSSCQLGVLNASVKFELCLPDC